MASGNILVFIIWRANLEHLRQYLAWLPKTGLPQKKHFLARVRGITAFVDLYLLHIISLTFVSMFTVMLQMIDAALDFLEL